MIAFSIPGLIQVLYRSAGYVALFCLKETLYMITLWDVFMWNSEVIAQVRPAGVKQSVHNSFVCTTIKHKGHLDTCRQVSVIGLLCWWRMERVHFFCTLGHKNTRLAVSKE